jgi:hypothetical protein
VASKIDTVKVSQLLHLNIKGSFDSGRIGAEEKDEINYLFHTTELQISSLKSQMKF